MLKKFVFVLGCVLVSYGAASASTVAVRDSVGVKVQNGKTYITHKVEPKETLYALSRKYGVPVAKITEVNKNIEKSLIVGQLVLIPILSKTPAATVAKTAQAPANKPADAPASTPAANRTYEIDDKGNKSMKCSRARRCFPSQDCTASP
ncbi:LysM domain-containing protein [Rufibacter sp. LB8]|uniref:LysM peptidoglycan-binding domain-containing protein n=1 Tax=Rufibacter sp. LB8 TaxID=2777781 RepID=UPI00178C78E9|nr:LysM domain-containing protein [Rufibacter sp. LB8]